MAATATTPRFSNIWVLGALNPVLDVRQIHALGWTAKMSLEEGIRRTLHPFDHNLKSPFPN